MAIKPLYLILDKIRKKKANWARSQSRITKKEISKIKKTVVWTSITHQITNTSLYSIRNYGEER
jgi:hypothetical protein